MLISFLFLLKSWISFVIFEYELCAKLYRFFSISTLVEQAEMSFLFWSYSFSNRLMLFFFVTIKLSKHSNSDLSFDSKFVFLSI